MVWLNIINSKDGRDFPRPIFMPIGIVEYILVSYMDIYSVSARFRKFYNLGDILFCAYRYRFDVNIYEMDSR